MTVFQTTNLSADAVKVRWKEPYVTAAVNQKTLASHPKGVLAGFGVVATGGGSYNVTVQVDPSLTLSIANVLETTGGLYSVTVVQNANVVLDLTPTAPPLTAYTAYLALDVQYVVGTASAVQIKVVDAAELASNLDLVLLAKVNVAGTGGVAQADVNLAYRDLAGDFETPEQSPPFNFVYNPSFELSTTGWTNTPFSSFDAMTASTDFAKTGSFSLKLEKTVAGLVNCTSSLLPVTPARKYRVSAWLHSPGGIASGSGAKFQLSFFDALGVLIGSEQTIEAAISTATAAFVQRKTEVTAPAGAFSAGLRILFDNSSGILYVDDVEFSPRLPEIGNAPSKSLANFFTKTLTVTPDSPSGAPALVGVGLDRGSGVSATGGGSGPATFSARLFGAGASAVGGAADSHGLVARGGNVANPGVITGAHLSSGVIAVGTGAAGFGVVGVGSAANGSVGVKGEGSDGFDTVGVVGIGKGTGAGGVFSGAGTGPAIDASSDKIVNVANPTALQDAATKAYVDQRASAVGNLVINGRFDFWQRGTSVVLAGTPAPGFANAVTIQRIYGPDRWHLFNEASGTGVAGPACTLSRQSVATGAENYPFVARLQRDAGSTATGKIGLAQELDRDFVKLFRGTTVQLTVLLRTGADFTGSVIGQVFTGDGATSEFVWDPAVFADPPGLGYTGTVTVPVSVVFGSGTPGAASFTEAIAVATLILPLDASVVNLTIRKTSSGTAGADDWVEVAGVRLTPTVGGLSIPYRFAGGTIEGELGMCQRFFEKSYAVATDPGSVTSAGYFVSNVLNRLANNTDAWFAGAHPRFLVSKRVAPTVQLWTTGGTLGSWQVDASALATSAISISERGFVVANNTGGPVTPTAGYLFGQWAADAEI